MGIDYTCEIGIGYVITLEKINAKFGREMVTDEPGLGWKYDPYSGKEIVQQTIQRREMVYYFNDKEYGRVDALLDKICQVFRLEWRDRYMNCYDDVDDREFVIGPLSEQMREFEPMDFGHITIGAGFNLDTVMEMKDYIIQAKGHLEYLGLDPGPAVIVPCFGVY